MHNPPPHDFEPSRWPFRKQCNHFMCFGAEGDAIHQPCVRPPPPMPQRAQRCGPPSAPSTRFQGNRGDHSPQQSVLMDIGRTLEEIRDAIAEQS